MSIFTTLVKEFSTGTVSVWTFCVTDNGKYRAFGNNGKTKFFPTLEDFEATIEAYRGYGYTSRAAQLVKQLSLI